MTCFLFFFFQAEDGIRDYKVTGVQTCALPISRHACSRAHRGSPGGVRPRRPASPAARDRRRVPAGGGPPRGEREKGGGGKRGEFRGGRVIKKKKKKTIRKYIDDEHMEHC